MAGAFRLPKSEAWLGQKRTVFLLLKTTFFLSAEKFFPIARPATALDNDRHHVEGRILQ
jgi:hypothetical protein